MIRQFLLATMFVLTLSILGATGCGRDASKSTKSTEGVETEAPPATGEAAHEHDHPSEGPHGGSLIELGSEEYHAELVHDDQAKTVTIYLLDAKAKASVPIEATEVTINLTHQGKGEQFKLAASPDQTDPQGKSSRFVSSDAELAEDLDHEGAEPQLAVTINGTPYRGSIEHHHEHDEGEKEHDHK